MSIVKKLTDKMDVRAILEELNFQHIKSAGSQLRSCCAIHQGNNDSAFVINKKTGMWYCFTGCQSGGDIYDLIMQVNEIGFTQAVRWLADIQGVTVDWDKEEIDENYFRDEAKKFIEQMMKRINKKELPEYTPKGLKFSKINDYRGYSPETIEHWKLRYCTEGELKDRIVIPLEDVDKRLVGLTGRATLSEQQHKFFHRPRSLHTGYFLTGLGRNLEYVREANNSVIITEGIFDAARWWDCGYKFTCCPIGTFLTEEHMSQLFKAGVTTAYLAFDADKAGMNGIRKAIKKMTHKFDLYVLAYPEGKDADDLSQDELDKVFSNKLTVWEWYDKYGKEIVK